MNQQQQFEIDSEKLQQDIGQLVFLNILQPAFEVGRLYVDQDHSICKVLFNKLDCDSIIQNGIEYFQGDIEKFKKQVELNKQSNFNNGIIQYIKQGLLPAYYNHYNWECTLQNILKTLQDNKQLMKKQTALWISKSIAQVINLQHKHYICLMNISIASVVFRNDFDFSQIQFNGNGDITDFYKFILLNFSDASQKELKSTTKQTLEMIVDKKFNSGNKDYILQQGPISEPDSTEQVQLFIYQLRNHVEQCIQTIENVNFDKLERRLTVKITNFDCAERSDPKNQRSEITLSKIPLKEQHPNITQPNFNPIQQDYFSLGIILFWIFNHSESNKNQIPNKKDFRVQYYLRAGINEALENQFNQTNDFLDQIQNQNSIPEEYQGLLSADLNTQNQAFNKVLNLEYDFGQIEQLQYQQQHNLADYYQQ